MFLALEKIGDLYKNIDIKKSEIYYNKIINEFFLLVKENFENNSIINEKIILIFIKTSRKLGLEIENIEEFYLQLISINPKYLLLFSNFKEENGFLTEAFINYMFYYDINLNENKEDAINAILMFLETKVIDKLDTEINLIKSQEESGGVEYLLELEKLTLKEIIKIVEKYNNIDEKDISFIFGLILGKEFYENLSIQSVIPYFNNYNNGIIHYDIYLKSILKNIEKHFGYEKEILENFFSIIDCNQKFILDDLNDLKDILDSSIYK